MKIHIKLIGLALLAITSLYSCKKKIGEPIDLKHEYFPVETGNWVMYDVTSIEHDNTSDTFNYQIREVITGDFIDNQGRLAKRIERFIREDDTQSWQIRDVWTSIRTTETAEKVEEDVRFTKMAFPIDYFKSWNGNAYNTMDEWTYFYEQIDEAAIINSIAFDSIVKINQIDVQNFVQYQKGHEVYAKHIGLVEKQLILLEIDNGDPTDITRGTEFYQSVIDYGTN